MDVLTTAAASFVSKGECADGNLRLALSGEIDMASNAALSTVLTATHEEAVRAKVGTVSVDLTALNFVNSSGLKHFVTWLRAVSELAPSAGYRITFICSRVAKWQQRSIEVLRCFAPDVVTVVMPEA